MLIHMLSDLARNSELCDRYARSPAEVAERYELPEDIQELLKSGDRRKIEDHLHGEVTQFLDAFSASERVVFLPYPGCEPAVTSITPSTVNTGVSASFVVTGTCFVAGSQGTGPAELYFERPGVTVKATNVRVSTGHTKLTGDATFSETGTYDVIVKNPDGKTGTLAGGLDVV